MYVCLSVGLSARGAAAQATRSLARSSRYNFRRQKCADLHRERVLSWRVPWACTDQAGRVGGGRAAAAASRINFHHRGAAGDVVVLRSLVSRPAISGQPSLL